MSTAPIQSPATGLQTPAPSVPPPPPPTLPQVPAPPGAPGGAADIAALRGQVAELRAQLTGLNAEARVIRGQLRHPGDAEVRSQLVAHFAEVSAQIGQVQGQLAQVQAELAARQALESQQGVPPHPFRPQMHSFDPDFAAGLMFAFIFAVMMPISIAYARRIWRGKPVAQPRPDDVVSGQRLERLEQSVDAIAIEIERISEGQRFVTKVLATRLPDPAAAPVVSPDAQPIRALGAGPMEPIRMPERQAVRQSITPH